MDCSDYYNDGEVIAGTRYNFILGQSGHPKN